jgi:hypothetical protein
MASHEASQNLCRTVDQPAAALVTDLKQRGLLDDTLVVFATECGRTSFAQGTLKGNNIAKDPVHIHDVNATSFRAPGIDHAKVTFRS